MDKNTIQQQHAKPGKESGHVKNLRDAHDPTPPEMKKSYSPHNLTLDLLRKRKDILEGKESTRFILNNEQYRAFSVNNI